MNSSDNYYITQISNIKVNLYKYVVPLFYIFGNFGNLLSIGMFLKKSWRKNVCVFYFLIYILCNICYLNSTTLASIFNSGYQSTIQKTNVVLCKIYIYAAFLFATLSPTILILASIDRLLISSQNIHTRLYSSKRLAYFSISISTIFWIIFNSHILIKVNIQQFTPTLSVCYYERTKFYLDFVFFSLMSIHILFGLMMFILCLVSFKHVRQIQNLPRPQQRNQIRTMKKKDFQLLRCLFVQNVVFITFALLINVYYMYETVVRDRTQTLLQQTINQFVDNVLSILYNTPYCSNFYICIFVSKAFRHEVKRLAFKICRIKQVSLREEENNNGEFNMAVVTSAGIS
ncbi:hypothetical protein I4U23_004568 [Adineta vaga]|nr:hypothetical protein I4U23_004568 [Adineta vaga]